jgi:hypothetical protein
MLNLGFSFNSLQLSHLKNKFATSVLVHDRGNWAVTQAEEKPVSSSTLGSRRDSALREGAQRWSRRRNLYRFFRHRRAVRPVRSRAAQVTLRRSDRIHRPKPPSIRHRQLHRTTRGGDCRFQLPLHGAVCRIPLGQAPGDSRRLYRWADPDRARNGLCRCPGARRSLVLWVDGARRR